MKRKEILILLVSAVLFGWGCVGSSKRQSSRNVATTTTSTTKTSNRVAAKNYGFRVVAEIPHSTEAYTQGFQYVDGFFWEGTGGYGSSSLRKIDASTGAVLKRIDLARSYFGEGITLLGDKIYQLTWHERKAFVYNKDSFKKVATFDYIGEGWGITTDGEKLYMSNGSDVITVRDAATFEPERTFSVKLSGRKIAYINELEWIEGEIWANVYMTNEIIRINPADGTIVGIINLEGLQSPSDVNYNTDVLNGIAYDKETGRIWVTGKNWNKIYQIELTNKDGN